MTNGGEAGRRDDGGWRPDFPSGLEQPAGSMRFALDSLLLPCFAAASLRARPLRVRNPLRDRAFGPALPGFLAGVDLGCGCGASSLALLRLAGNVKLWGVDLVEELAASARSNAVSLGLQNRARFEARDVADLARTRRPCCDLAQMNPPYWAAGEGLPSPSPLADMARRSGVGLRDFLAAARALLVFHGRLFVIFPAARLVPLLGDLDAHGFGVRRLQAVRPFADAPATRVLGECWRAAAHDTAVEPDLVIYERGPDGASLPTAAVRAFCPWVR